MMNVLLDPNRVTGEMIEQSSPENGRLSFHGRDQSGYQRLR